MKSRSRGIRHLLSVTLLFIKLNPLTRVIRYLGSGKRCLDSTGLHAKYPFCNGNTSFKVFLFLLPCN